MKHFRFSFGVLTGAAISAVVFWYILQSQAERNPDFTGLGFFFALVVFGITVLATFLPALLASLLIHRRVQNCRFYLSGLLSGVLILPGSIFAGLATETPFSGTFLLNVCVITIGICLLIRWSSVTADIARNNRFKKIL